MASGDTTGGSSQAAVLQAYRRALLTGGPLAADLVAALNDLFAAQGAMVLAVCRRFVGDEERARDLAQDALLRAFERLPQYRGEASFRTWLYSIARTTCLAALRRREELLVEDGVLDPADPGMSALRRLHASEREELLREATAAVLAPLEQEAVYLRYVERIPQERIGDILGVGGASGGRGLLQRCRRKLQRALRERLAALGHGSSYVRETL